MMQSLDQKLEVPEDVMIEILLRLPPKSLLRLRAACRRWQAIMDGHSFIYRHLNFMNNDAATTTSRGHIINFAGDLSLKSLSLSVAILLDDRVLDLEAAPSCIWKGKGNHKKFSPLSGPVNGIYCSIIRPLTSGLGTLILWNPGIRHSLILPPIPRPPNSTGCYLFFWGFGFDFNTSDYKIVGISNYYGDMGEDSRDYFSCFHLYSLATNSWKQLDPFQIIDHNHHSSNLIKVFEDARVYFEPLLAPWEGIYLNGASHWDDSASLDLPESCIGSIIAFGFGSQVFRVFYVPKPNNDASKSYTDVTSINGCLALVCAIRLDGLGLFPDPSIFDVYVMREYGIQESWTRAYTLNLHSSPGDFMGVVDDEFFVEGHGHVVSYCLRAPEPEQECHVYCQVNAELDYYRIFPFRESLVPIKVSDELINNKKKKKKKNHQN